MELSAFIALSVSLRVQCLLRSILMTLIRHRCCSADAGVARSGVMLQYTNWK